MSNEIWKLPADQLWRLMCLHKLSPVEVVKSTLARIEQLQPVLNCFVTVCGERALGDARTAEAALVKGEMLGLLNGIPYTAKDLVNTAGVRTTFGSLVYQDNVPDEDAASVAGMRNEGAILIGKTTTPEFGHKGMTDAPLFGRTRNAWNAGRTSGGSSGGAAVAVAAGLAPLAIATDGGGSTRIPAACNGVVGFKQSLGVVPHSQSPDAFGMYTYVTPMTRTVMDTGLMLQAMSHEHWSDPWSGLPKRVDYVDAARPQGTLKGKRIAAALLLGNEVVSHDVRRTFDQAITKLADLGAEVEELREPLPAQEPIWQVINHATWSARFSDMIATHEARMSPSLVRQVRLVKDHSATDLQRAMFARTDLFRTVQRWFQRYDALVTPTLARSAVPIDQDFFADVEIDNRTVGEIRKSWYPYTMPFNITGHPAVSLPCGFGSDGLPLALQVVGRLRGDADLLRIAALYEQAAPWADKWPEL
jgi:aspartyl-tRNA(Asn)/glutamyl-tRNA(Gln) amidotransferase subunit A